MIIKEEKLAAHFLLRFLALLPPRIHSVHRSSGGKRKATILDADRATLPPFTIDAKEDVESSSSEEAEYYDQIYNDLVDNGME